MVFDLLLIALAITLDPLPLMAFVLVVASVRGVRTGLAFLAGWMACFIAVIALVLTLTGGQPPAPRSPPSTANLVIKVVIGVSLVVYGLRRHRRPVHHGPSDAVTPPPKGKSSSFLTSRMDRGALWPAAGLAILLQPWGLVAAGAVTVVEADGSDPTTWLVLAAYCIIATATLLGAELYVVFKPASAQRRLRELRAWMQGHAEQAIVYGSVVVGLLLVGKSVYELAG
ncbi:GAP family protein [Streptomyces guryensis]|uniref:GAP family protein n=1 Tax=Streptomyces guryensis TaxID=2886947 RepID=A0A9Q3Z6P6_9ACTN|nr:GAP family protein [Streptomyces guryensis]MCD9876433.1 GAP family protein [Streptomyces guryensis]